MSAVGFGSQLQVNISGTLTAVAEVVSISGPSMTVGEVDTRNLASSGQWATSLPGWKDGGKVSAELRFNAAQVNTFAGMLGAVQVWRIVLSTGSKWDFSGYITSLNNEIPLETDITVPVEIRLTGAPTFTV